MSKNILVLPPNLNKFPILGSYSWNARHLTHNVVTKMNKLIMFKGWNKDGVCVCTLSKNTMTVLQLAVKSVRLLITELAFLQQLSTHEIRRVVSSSFIVIALIFFTTKDKYYDSRSTIKQATDYVMQELFTSAWETIDITDMMAELALLS